MSPTLVTLSKAISPGRSSWRGLHPLSPALHRISWILNYTHTILSPSRSSLPVTDLVHTLVCWPAQDLPGVLAQPVQAEAVVSDGEPLGHTLGVTHPLSSLIQCSESEYICLYTFPCSPITHVSLVTTGVSLVWVLYLVFSDHSDRVWSRLVSGQCSPGYLVQNAANCINIHCSTKLK